MLRRSTILAYLLTLFMAKQTFAAVNVFSFSPIPSLAGQQSVTAPEVLSYEALPGYSVGLSIGGATSTGDMSNEVKIFFPDTEGDASLGPLPIRMKDFAAFIYQDNLYVLGGYETNTDTYDPANDIYNRRLYRLDLSALNIRPGPSGGPAALNLAVWEVVPNYIDSPSNLPDYGPATMQTLGHFSARNNYVLVGDRLYVFGPRTPEGESSSHVFVFSIKEFRWLLQGELGNLANLPASSEGASICYDATNNLLYLHQGVVDYEAANTIFRTTLGSGVWTAYAPGVIGPPVVDISMACSPAGDLLLAGGIDNGAGETLPPQRYDPVAKRWDVNPDNFFPPQYGEFSVTYESVKNRFYALSVTGSAAASLGNGNFHVATFEGGSLEQSGAYQGIADIRIEQPVGTELMDGSSTVDFGSKALATNTDISFSIENDGFTALTSISANLSGSHSGDFSLQSTPSSTLQYDGDTSFTVRFTPSAAGTRTALLTVSSNDPDEGNFEISLTGEGLTPVGVWLQSKFTTAEITNPAVSGLEIDIEKDGLTNAIEYILDLEPKVADSMPWSGELVSPSGTTHLSMTIDLPENLPSDGTIIVKETGSLETPISWSTLATKTGSGDWVESNGGIVTEGTPSEGKVSTEIRSGKAVGNIIDGPSNFMRIEFSVDGI